MTRKTRTNPAQQAIQKARKENAKANAEIRCYKDGKPVIFYRDELVEDTNGNIGRIIDTAYGRINVKLSGRRVHAYHANELTVVKSPWR